MSQDSPAPKVRHNHEQRRYEIEVDGELSILNYEPADGQIIIHHTFVPPEHRGRGLAERLVRSALDKARKDGLKVQSTCSYVSVFLQRHRKEYADITA